MMEKRKTNSQNPCPVSVTELVAFSTTSLPPLHPMNLTKASMTCGEPKRKRRLSMSLSLHQRFERNNGKTWCKTGQNDMISARECRFLNFTWLHLQTITFLCCIQGSNCCWPTASAKATCNSACLSIQSSVSKHGNSGILVILAAPERPDMTPSVVVFLQPKTSPKNIPARDPKQCKKK